MDTDLLVEFLNTFDEEELTDDAATAAWFRAHGLPHRGITANEARRVRDALRKAADGRTVPPADLACCPLRVVVRDGAPALVSDSALGTFVATAVQLAFEGKWERLKLCDAGTCRYAFFDTSKNRSGKWCDMAICGNRAKTKAFRERHRG